MSEQNSTDKRPEFPLRAAIVPVTPFQQNCTIIWNEDTMVGALVDPGGDPHLIRKALEQSKVKIEKIIITHGHIDHVGAAAEMAEELGVKIEGPHKADAEMMQNVELQAQKWGIGGVRNVASDRWLEEGETVTIGGATFDIYHCPGHSPGSVVLVNKDQRIALVGDVLFQGSVGRTDLPGGDHETLIRSIKAKLLPLGDDIAFICGHGPMSSFGQEREFNPFLN